MKYASNTSLLCLGVAGLLAVACATAHREREPMRDQRGMQFQDPVDSLIDSMVKDRNTWVDPAVDP